MLEAAKHMGKTEGWQAFYKGLTPALAQVVPRAGIKFASYSLLKNFWVEHLESEGTASSLQCSVLFAMHVVVSYAFCCRLAKLSTKLKL